jgi:outer membrane murein-binding lipoprotein Lpp
MVCYNIDKNNQGTLMKNTTLFLLTTLLLAGCSSMTMITTNKKLPEVYVDINKTDKVKNDIKITLFKLSNYTDTPRAGQRASNILQGILLAKGYSVTTKMENEVHSLNAAQTQAKEDASQYFLIGGVSEWRYKTGIDGEPAVSLQLRLYDTNSAKLIWSATGADSDWGTGSIGTTAQNLINTMTSK